MIDSHCHLDYDPLFTNLNDVIKRGELNGVKKYLTISTTLKSFESIKVIISKYKNIFGTFGIHPHECKNFPLINKKKIIDFKKSHEKIIGIGETGLDFFYNFSDSSLQKKIFVEHIEASIELNVPLIVHSRNAEKETFNILSDYHSKKPKILMHCFTGSVEFSKKMLDLGAYISFSGIITFKNASELQRTASTVPLDRILIETDSPYLSPEPKRGMSNEPSFIKYTATKLSELKKVSLESIVQSTTNNFLDLFSIKK